MNFHLLDRKYIMKFNKLLLICLLTVHLLVYFYIRRLMLKHRHINPIIKKINK